MMKLFKSLMIIILTQLFAILFFVFLSIVLDLDFYNAFNQSTSSALHNSLIFIVYCFITVCLNLYFKSGYKLPKKPMILGVVLLIVYLVLFYLSNQNEYLFKYFLLIHYPMGSYFRTVPYSHLDLWLKLLISLSILSASMGVGFGQLISRMINKKKKLSSLSK